MPRRSTQRDFYHGLLNLDLGFSAYQYRVKYDLDNGYYDPHRYEFYGVSAAPYWKASESNGLGILIVTGLQRDERSRTFRMGGNAAVEATFGIYGPWILKVNAAATLNGRLQSGAFRGLRGGFHLARRF